MKVKSRLYSLNFSETGCILGSIIDSRKIFIINRSYILASQWLPAAERRRSQFVLLKSQVNLTVIRQVNFEIFTRLPLFRFLASKTMCTNVFRSFAFKRYRIWPMWRNESTLLPRIQVHALIYETGHFCKWLGGFVYRCMH